MMPNAIQPWEYSRGGGMDGILYTCAERRWQPLRPVSQQWRWQGCRELEQARQRLERQQPCWSSRNSHHFSPDILLGEFCFVSCPFQPPSIFPISSKWTDRAIYLLSSRDFVSHKTISNTRRVSAFLVASLTQGNLSSRTKKLALETASIVSTKRISIFCPKECLCSFGMVW